MKKLVSLILAALLCMLCCTSFATECVFDSTQQFLDELDANGVRYDYQGVSENSGKEIVYITYTCDNVSSIEVAFLFNDDCEDAALRVWNLIDYEAAMRISVVDALNTLNQDYRFVKFRTDDDDNSVTAEMDLIFRANDVGPICNEAMARMIQICDEAYLFLKPFRK